MPISNHRLRFRSNCSRVVALGLAAGAAWSSWALAAEAGPGTSEDDLIGCRKRALVLQEAKNLRKASDELELCHGIIVAIVAQKQKSSPEGLAAMLMVERQRAEVNIELQEWRRAAEGMELFLALQKTLLRKEPTAQESEILQGLQKHVAGGSSPSLPTPGADMDVEVGRLPLLLGQGKQLEALAVIERLAPSIESASPAVRLTYYAFGGLIYDLQLKFAQAEGLLRKALAVSEAKNSPASEKALVLNLLATHYLRLGDLDKAERYALRNCDEAAHAGPSALTSAFGTLSRIYADKRAYTQALAAAEQGLAVAKKAYKPDDTQMVQPQAFLAHVLDETGEYARAEALLLRNKQLLEKAKLTSSLPYLGVLENLGWHYRAVHDYRKSADFYAKRMELLLKLEAPVSLAVANAKCQMAETFWNLKDYARAVPLGIQCNDTKEKYLTSVLASGSEDQRKAYISTLLHETDVSVSVHVQGAQFDSRLGRFALDTVLRRKGRVLDAMADTMARARAGMSESDRARLERLATVRGVLASSALAGGNTGSLLEEAQTLEAQLSQSSASFRARSAEISTHAVQAAMPDGAVLVEIVSYRPYDFKAKLSESHADPEYVAYVLHKEGEPKFVALGKSEVINRDVSALRDALSKNKEVKAFARSLDAKVMAPIRPLLGGAQRIFLSPDGALNLIPFAALVDPQGKFLVETTQLTYVTTGRDLLRFSNREAPATDVTVFANPDYQSAITTEVGKGTRASMLQLGSIPPLPGTAEEAKAIASIIPYAKVLSNAEATEFALKHLPHPRVLHVATHGFFLGDTGTGEGKTRSLEYVVEQERSQVLREENPLLRSGLLLAGAAGLRGGNGEDGVLTALEASSLDLHGTGLVVLSACQTAVGEVKTGDGVYGLRRAMVIAGAETTVMSLWSVDDDATRELMTLYYRRLKEGQGRSDALRQVQIAMLNNPKWSSPYYWAAFIPSGDPSPMEFPTPAPAKPAVVASTGTTASPPSVTTSSSPPPSAAESDDDDDDSPGSERPDLSWFRLDSDVAHIGLSGVDMQPEAGSYAFRIRGELPIITPYILRRSKLRFSDALGAQYVTSFGSFMQREISYDAMFGYSGDEFGLYAGVRCGIGTANAEDLRNGGTFVPIVGRLRLSGVRAIGWGGNLAGQRAVWGGALSVPIDTDAWLDLGYQDQKGRSGESSSATVWHGGFGFNL
jgi:CHAT domain-containing protein